MGDQWAVDSANSRAALQIHRKRHGRRTHTSHAGTWKRVGVHGSTKRMQQIQVRKACKCNYSARGFSESEQEQILVNLLSNPLCLRLRDDFTAPLRAPLCRIQPPLCLCPRWRFTSIIGVVRLLQRVEINRLQFWLIWYSDWVVSGSTKTKVSGISIGCRSLQGSREHSSQMSTRYETNCLIDDYCTWTHRGDYSRSAETGGPFIFHFSLIPTLLQPRTPTDGPVIGLVCPWTSTTDRFDIFFLDSGVLIDVSRNSGLGITFTPFHL